MAFTDRRHLPGAIHIEDAGGVCFTLLTGTDRAVLIDAGYGFEDVYEHVRSMTGLPLTLWLTHVHHDHALGAMWFSKARMHPLDAAYIETYTGAAQRRKVLSVPGRAAFVSDRAVYLEKPMPGIVFLDREVLDLGGMTVHIIPCPGHTPGSVVVWIPERRLLLTGDNWNRCTWLFFQEALPIKHYRANLNKLLELPFEWVLCPHCTELFRRKTFESFIMGLTDEAIHNSEPSDTGNAYGVRTHSIKLPEDQMIVFDADKAG